MKHLSLVFKLVLAVSLLLWMLGDGRLDATQLGIFTERPMLAVLALVYWVVGPLLLASLRVRILLICAGYRLTILRSIWLQLTGFFFTTVMPGSLGGDFVKVFYLIRDNPGRDKSSLLWAILFDRIVGMCGLFVVGAIFITADLKALWEIPLLRPLILVVYGYLVGFCAFLVVLRAMRSDAGIADLGHRAGVAAKLYQFITACRIYRDRMPAVLLSVLLSTISHGLSFVLFVALAWGIWGHPGHVDSLAAVFPVGMLITTLPLSPGGLGVGHLAFDQLFRMTSMSDGANVYNAYFVSQTLLNLTGVFAYFAKGSGKAEAPDADHPAMPAVGLATVNKPR